MCEEGTSKDINIKELQKKEQQMLREKENLLQQIRNKDLILRKEMEKVEAWKAEN